MATLLRANGMREEVQPRNSESFVLSELQGYVAGYIEILDVGEGIIVLNEEGKLDDLPFNYEATLLARPYLAPWDDGIRGDVVVCRSEEVK